MSDVVSRRKQTSPTTAATRAATTFAELSDDLHAHIFLRSPPQPHWLLPVSQVCRRWHRLVTSLNFLRSFRARHGGTPPLIGLFHDNCQEGPQRFIPTAGEDAAMAATVGALRCQTSWRILDCRHGRVLFLGADAAARDGWRRFVLVLWDPMAGGCERIRMPPAWTVYDNGGAVTGAMVCRGGDCRYSPFKVVLMIRRAARLLVSVYSSVAGEWSEVISYKGLPRWADPLMHPCVVTGSTVYQPLLGHQTLSFDLETKTFVVISHPPATTWLHQHVRNIRLDGGVLGVVAVDNVDFSIALWVREDDGWVQEWTIQVNMLGKGELRHVKLLGACENGNFILLWTRLGIFMLRLQSMELKEMPIDYSMTLGNLYPYQSFFARLRPCITPNLS